jgi:hypothetical protein
MASMNREKLSIIMITLTLLTFALVGCSSISEKMASILDPSIVWVENFENGDADG